MPDRTSSSMPAIRCADCGSEVPLTIMGAHVCSKTGDANAASVSVSVRRAPSTPPAPGRESSFQKPQRPPLPKIDPYAGRPVVQFGELTPASSSHGSLEYSPRSASSGQRSPWRPPPRKVSAPPLRRPPSPELTNLDCAFPPFPIPTTSRSKTSVNDRKSKQSDGGSVHTRTHASTHHYSAANTNGSSPSDRTSLGRTSGGARRATSMQSSRQRTSSSTKTPTFSQPTSASTSRRPSFAHVLGTQKGSLNIVPPLPTSSPVDLSPRVETIPDQPPATAAAAAAAATTEEADLSDMRPPVRHEHSLTKDEFLVSRDTFPKLPSQNPTPVRGLASQHDTDADFIGPAREQIECGESVSKGPSYRTKGPPAVNSGQSLPLLTRFKSIIRPRRRAPSFPQPKKPSEADCLESSARRPSNPVIVQQSSRVVSDSHDTETLPQDYSPQTFQFEFIPLENPPAAHSAPLEGTSETEADLRQVEGPVGAGEEEISHEMERVPRGGQTRATHHTSTDSASSYDSVTLSLPSASSRSSLPSKSDHAQIRPDTASDAELANVQPSSSEAVSTKSELIPDVTVESNHQPGILTDNRIPGTSDVPVLVPLRITTLQPDSPTDPLCQQGRLSPIPASPDRRAPTGRRKASQSTTRSAPSRNYTATTNKGVCRGCSTIIAASQKSVSSADGRLTGRYHKECFVCRTCKSPFVTADFYVLDDHPYCAYDYHELNGTICGSCDTGIEGPYIETSTVGGKPPMKFHADCLACTTCRTPLREDYFEFNGRMYCETDVFRVASLPGRNQNDNVPSRSSPLVRELVTSGESDA